MRRLVGDFFEYRDLGAVAVKGIAAPMPAWQVLCPSGVTSWFKALRGTALTTLVDEELAPLQRRREQAKAGEGCVVWSRRARHRQVAPRPDPARPQLRSAPSWVELKSKIAVLHSKNGAAEDRPRWRTGPSHVGGAGRSHAHEAAVRQPRQGVCGRAARSGADHLARAAQCRSD